MRGEDSYWGEPLDFGEESLVERVLPDSSVVEEMSRWPEKAWLWGNACGECSSGECAGQEVGHDRLDCQLGCSLCGGLDHVGRYCEEGGAEQCEDFLRRGRHSRRCLPFHPRPLHLLPAPTPAPAASPPSLSSSTAQTTSPDSPTSPGPSLFSAPVLVPTPAPVASSTPPRDVITHQILIPHRLHRLFTGEGRVLRWEAVEITFPFANTRSDKVALKGPKTAVEAAVRKIKSKIGGEMEETRGDVYVLLSGDSELGAVIGHRGHRAEAFRRAHPQVDIAIQSELLRVRLRGAPGPVARAKEDLNLRLLGDDGVGESFALSGAPKRRGRRALVAASSARRGRVRRDRSRSGSFVDVACSSHLFGYLIGQGGSRVRVWEERYPCVDFDFRRSDDGGIRLTSAEPAQLAKAAAEIARAVEEALIFEGASPLQEAVAFRLSPETPQEIVYTGSFGAYADDY